MRFIGLNLTVPHKLLALELVDELDASARTMGAVNTIRFEARDHRGEWRPLREASAIPVKIRTQGFNTDADALVRALREDAGVEVLGASVLLVGAGGAGRTAALKLAAEGVGKLFLVNRTAAKAEALAAELAQRFPRLNVCSGAPAEPVDLLLNATSAGLRPEDPLPFDEREVSLEKVKVVYDMIYRPAETALLKRAQSAGCRTANGLGMLLYQGVKALEIWSGQSAPVPVMRRALMQNVYPPTDPPKP